MSFLHEPGDLARTPLAAVLLEALNLRATGTLVVQHAGGSSRLFVKDGKPVGAQVATGMRPLGHMLLQAGIIDIDALSRSLALMAENHRPQGEILVEMGAASREQVDRVLVEQQAAYFGAIAALEGGSFQFDPSAPVPAWAGPSLLSPLRTIVDALERPQAGALVISALQPVSASSVRLASGYRSVESAFRWNPQEQALVSRLEAPISLEEFFAPCEVPPERARAILAGVLLLGLAVSAGDAPQATGETVAGLEVDLGMAARQSGIHAAPPPPEPASAAPAPTMPSPAAAVPPPAAPAPPPSSPARRSDPAEARARRQRLLQQAMRNMGIGPFAGAGAPRPHPAAAQPSPPAPSQERPPGDAAEVALRKALLDALPRAREKDLFVRLGLQPGAGRDQVKQAFLSLARQYHPDRFASPALADLAETVKEFFTAVNEAYEVLSDDKKRNAYVAQRSEAGSDAARMEAAKGEACLRTRDWGKARGFFEAALRVDPRAEYKAALALAIVSDPACRERERARSLAEEALRTPSCDRAAYVAGLLARDERNDARAEQMFRAAVASNPRNADAARELKALERKRAR